MKKITIGLLLLTGSLFGQVKLNQLAPAPTGSVMTIVTNSTTGIYTYTAPSLTGTGSSTVTGTFPNYIISNSSDVITTATQTLTNKTLVTPIIGTITGVSGANGLTILTNNTASSSIARGINFTPTLIASANNDVLIGLDVNTTFTNGAFTGITNFSARYSNDISINSLIAGKGTSNLNSCTGFGAGVLQLSNNTARDNTAMGYYDLSANTTGYENSAFGHGAMISNITGNSNAGFGYRAIRWNTSGSGNAALGTECLESNTSGGYNTAIGGFALSRNLTGSYNAVVGYQSMYNNISGSYGVAIGYNAMFNCNNTATPFNNTNIAIGFSSMRSSATLSLNIGGDNLSIGYSSMYNVSTGYQNQAFGSNTMYNLTSGARNQAMGYNSLFALTSGTDNNAIGDVSLRFLTTGALNTSIGSNSQYSNINGSSNISVGYNSLYTNQSSNNVSIGVNSLLNVNNNANTALGYEAGRSINSGSNNTFIGNDAGYNASQKLDAVNSMALGNTAFTTKSNQIVLGNTSVVETVINGKTILMPSTTSIASENIPSGVAPTTPVNGDVWNDGTDLKTYVNSTTQTILKGVRGTVSVAGATAQTAFTVTFGGIQPNNTFYVGITALNAVTAAQNYVMTRTTTTFTVTYLTGLTGTVAFDWVLIQ